MSNSYNHNQKYLRELHQRALLDQHRQLQDVYQGAGVLGGVGGQMAQQQMPPTCQPPRNSQSGEKTARRRALLLLTC